MKKLLGLFVLAALVLTGAAIANDGANLAKIDLKTLQTMIEKNDNFVLIDSRGGKYFDGEVIKGAKHLPADQQDEKSLSAIVPSKDTKIVFYCTNIDCPASANAAHKAIEAGYMNVEKYPGGIEEWKKAGLPTIKL